VQPCALTADPLPAHIDGFEPMDEARQALWPAGEHAAQQRLTQFIARAFGAVRHRTQSA
jgi:deoxyribodipyrimidine photo-lyase